MPPLCKVITDLHILELEGCWRETGPNPLFYMLRKLWKELPNVTWQVSGRTSHSACTGLLASSYLGNG